MGWWFRGEILSCSVAPSARARGAASELQIAAVHDPYCLTRCFCAVRPVWPMSEYFWSRTETARNSTDAMVGSDCIVCACSSRWICCRQAALPYFSDIALRAQASGCKPGQESNAGADDDVCLSLVVCRKISQFSVQARQAPSMLC